MLVALHVFAVAWALAAAFLWLQRQWRRHGSTTESRYESARWLKSAGLLVVLAGLTKLYAEIDTLMIGFLQDTEQAGVYAVVSRLAGIPMLLCVATTAVISPAMAALSSIRSTEKLQRLFCDSVALLVIGSIPIVGILLLYGHQILELVGPRFTTGHAALVALVIGYLIHNLFGPVGVLLNMAGHEWATVRVFTISVLLKTVLNCLLIPRCGLEGAAVGTALTLVLIQLLLAIEVWLRLRVPFALFYFMRRGLAFRSG
jgi:O-antigen/teichoic acid export membrane protein